MPNGSIPHGNQRPKTPNRHRSTRENPPKLDEMRQSADETPEPSYEDEMVAQWEPAIAVIPGRALTDNHLTAFQFRVLSLMCGYANRKDRICWPKQETLARLLHTSVKVISNVVAQLIKLGYVEVGKSGFPARNVYRIIFDAPLEKPLAKCLPATESTPQWSLDAESIPQWTKSPFPSGLRVHSPVDSVPIEQKYIYGEEGETRVPARASLIDNIISAGDLPRQTNRAALAQLVRNHPQITEGEWTFQAAAAAAWYADHDRRMNLGNLGSWIVRYLREQTQLATAPSVEQEQPHGRPSQHRGPHGSRGAASQPGRVPADPRYPAGPDTDTDDLIPPGADEEALVEHYRRLTRERRRAEQAEREASRN